MVTGGRAEREKAKRGGERSSAPCRFGRAEGGGRARERGEPRLCLHVLDARARRWSEWQGGRAGAGMARADGDRAVSHHDARERAKIEQRWREGSNRGSGNRRAEEKIEWRRREVDAGREERETERERAALLLGSAEGCGLRGGDGPRGGDPAHPKL